MVTKKLLKCKGMPINILIYNIFKVIEKNRLQDQNQHESLQYHGYYNDLSKLMGVSQVKLEQKM